MTDKTSYRGNCPGNYLYREETPSPRVRWPKLRRLMRAIGHELRRFLAPAEQVEDR